MTPSGNAHLYPCPWGPKVPSDPRVVEGLRRGRQWAVDSAAYGKPYAFARVFDTSIWMISGGPFASEAAAEDWIKTL